MKTEETVETTERTIAEVGEDLSGYVLKSQKGKEEMVNETINFRKVQQN
jgi:hypothetical protein